MALKADNKKHINIPLPLDLHDKLVTRAKLEGRSLRQQIIWLLRCKIGEQEKSPT